MEMFLRIVEDRYRFDLRPVSRNTSFDDYRVEVRLSFFFLLRLKLLVTSIFLHFDGNVFASSKIDIRGESKILIVIIVSRSLCLSLSLHLGGIVFVSRP